MSIVNKLQQSQEAATAEALRRYAELLRADREDNASVEELRTLMTQLGKEQRDVAADAGVVKNATIYAARIAANKGLNSRLAQLKRDTAAYAEETQELARSRAARQEELEKQVAAMFEESAVATRDLWGLNKLIDAHPVLLSHIKRATFADFD